MTSKSQSRKKGTRLLSSMRPKLATQAKVPASLSSKTTRTLIRSHHTLQKRLAQAKAAGDTVLVESIKTQINQQGGLAKYQEASIQGQSAQRGGDSSKVLIQWLEELDIGLPLRPKRHLRLLEVGALRTDNACSKCGFFEVERIDLNSQHEDILQQDFMERPYPMNEDELAKNGFDVVSLSLVVNYVPDPVGRGDMLKRVRSFLRFTSTEHEDTHEQYPGLFLVLPSSCVTNSRYLDEQKLDAILAGLGYSTVKKKITAKLVYYYLRQEKDQPQSKQKFLKKELRSGGNRNNFAIVL